MTKPTPRTPYRYHGPVSGLTLDREEFVLSPGAVVSLPADHLMVRAYIRFGWLTALPSDPAPETALPPESEPSTRKTPVKKGA